MSGCKHRIRLNGFTLVELLITLVLTSLAITICYSALSYVQRLFSNYRQQSHFISEYTSLKNRMDHEAEKALFICQEDENTFRIVRDSTNLWLKLNNKAVILNYRTRSDTFHFQTSNIVKDYEPMSNPQWAGRLLRSLKFETTFSNQTFSLSLHKHYAAAVKLQLDQRE